MSGLAEFQSKLQRAIVSGDEQFLSRIAPAPRAERGTLLGVYQNAYVSRLVDALADEYEKLFALLGDEQFDAMARAYVALHPSHSPNLRWLGQYLPNFLSEQPPYREAPVLADLAKLERALNDAFDGKDAPRLKVQDLAQIAPEDWPTLTFTVHPTVRRFDHATNACDVWRALEAGDTPPQPRSVGEVVQLIGYRTEFTAHFRELSSIEATIWDSAASGAEFADICNLLEVHSHAEDAALEAAGYLKGWIEAGLLTSAVVQPPSAPATF